MCWRGWCTTLNNDIGMKTMGELFVASCAAVTGEGVLLKLPGQTQATQKPYQKLESANVGTGDLLLCVRISGTILVLGRIGEAEIAGCFFVPLGSAGLITADGRQFVSKEAQT